MAAKSPLPEEETLTDLQPTNDRLCIRCPKCRESIEVDFEADFTRIHCEKCGNDFDLADHNSTKGSYVERAIGQFDLIEEIGVGSFGTVWKARDTKLDRTVAIKMPRKGQLTPGGSGAVFAGSTGRGTVAASQHRGST